MIWDCFLFNNELNLLELRLQELDSFVDKFIVCEMPHNFQMKAKPLFFDQHKKRFEKWSDKIVHHVIREYPIAKHPVMEIFQRRSMFDPLVSVDPDDWILLGDVDEIPDVNKLRKHCQTQLRPGVCIQKLYYYWINCLQNQPWYGTVIFRRGLGHIDFQQMRNDRGGFLPIKDGGWHFSWLGPPSDISYKLQSIDCKGDFELTGHVPKDICDPEDMNRIERCMNDGEDLFGREAEFTKKRFVEIEPGILQPHTIEQWLSRYPFYAKSP